MKRDSARGKYYFCTDKLNQWMEGLLKKATDRLKRENLSYFGIHSVRRSLSLRVIYIVPLVCFINAVRGKTMGAWRYMLAVSAL